jgi:hypothetical protein
MRGSHVIVRAFGGVPLIRRIWDEETSLIYITNDEQFELLTKGKEALEPIGFPREDVFTYDSELASSMNQLYEDGKWDWNKLVPF